MSEDHYETLGVSRQATQEEIKKAYRRLAREHHPDANPDDVEAEARFKQVARAYEVLSDPERRQRFDQFGTDDPQAGGFGGGLGDIFDAFFGGNPFGGGGRGPSGPPRGTDLEAAIEVDFEAAVFGTQQPISVRTAVACADCEGSGAAPGTEPVTCPECHGAGQVQRVRQSLLGQMVTTGPCGRCGGMGQMIASPCATCRGEGRTLEERTYTVDIPAGIDSGQTLRLPGRGAAGPRGGAPGDLFVHVRVRSHPVFVRHGYDLGMELHVPMAQAALGASLDVETLDSVEEVPIPAGTQSGRTIRFRGRGVPHVDGRGRGDLVLQIAVDTPRDLGPEEEELLRRLAEIQGLAVEPADKSLLGKIRSAFS